MTRVRVDFNSRGPNGLVRGSRRRADGDVVVGDLVEVYDPDEDDMRFSARVVSVDPDTGLALFDVQWEQQEPVLPEGAVAVRSFNTTGGSVTGARTWPSKEWSVNLSRPVTL